MSTIDEQQIENALRHSPRPRPPGNLKARLLAQTKAVQNNRATQQTAIRSARPNWFQQWSRVLASAAVFLVCLIVLGVQQQQMRNLRQNIQTLSTRLESIASDTVADASSASEHNAASATAAETEEIARLKETVNRLTAEISQLEKLRAENQNLRSQLSAPPSPSRLSPQEVAAMDDQVERAKTIQCVNNMKQLALSVRVWATDSNDVFPPDIISMTNEMGTPKILCCPSDPAHSPAADWSSYTDANCSYEYLAPSANELEPQRVLFRCPIHGNIALCDGSVQIEAAKKHPDWLVQHDGKLYFEMKQ